MLKNYIKLAYRNLWKSKIFSTINILGLAIGIAASFMMFLIVFHELSYDQHIEDIERKGRVVLDDKRFEGISAQTSTLLSEEMKKTFPFVLKSARAFYSRTSISTEDKKDEKIRAYFIDSDLLDILSIQIKQGRFIDTKHSVIISESQSAKYFGNDNPIGKMLSVKINSKEYDISVTGVFVDIPEVSTLNTSVLFSMELGREVIDDEYQYMSKNASADWTAGVLSTFFEIRDENDFEKLDNMLTTLSIAKFPEDFGASMKFQKMENIYFESADFFYNLFPTGNKTKITIFTIVALLILFIASLNFILLSTAKSLKRYREIGIRKVIGASRISIISQIIFESIILALISLPLAFFITEISLPALCELLKISLSNEYYQQASIYLGFLIQTILIGSISGGYVAIHFSRMKPIQVLRNKVLAKNNGFQSRHALVSIQLVIAISLIISIVVVRNQIQFFRTSNMGFDKEELYVIEIQEYGWQTKYEPIKNELLSITGVSNVSAAIELPPIQGGIIYNFDKRNKPGERVVVNSIHVDYDFLNTLGLKLIKGRDFSKDYSTDQKNALILNETAVKELELDDANTIANSRLEVIGVVQDFNFRSLHTNITPMILQISKQNEFRSIVLKVDSENMIESINQINEKVEELLSTTNYDSYFYDEKIDNLYKEELNFATILNISTGLAIFITCLGLFGLTLFIAEQRTKEIGIRKVLGASVSNIVKMISKEFVLLVVIGSLIASPIAYYFMQKWLDNFAYKIEIGIDTFLLAGFIALAITLTTISIQAIRAAVANPVDSLRDE